MSALAPTYNNHPKRFCVSCTLFPFPAERPSENRQGRKSLFAPEHLRLKFIARRNCSAINQRNVYERLCNTLLYYVTSL